MTDLHAEPCGRSSPMLSQQMAQISREICDLLRQSSHCCLPASKFIPSYHHHFGRQCRVADYGYTKLAELFEALPHVLQVGDSSVVFTSWRCYRVFFSFLFEDANKYISHPKAVNNHGCCLYSSHLLPGISIISISFTL